MGESLARIIQDAGVFIWALLSSTFVYLGGASQLLDFADKTGKLPTPIARLNQKHAFHRLALACVALALFETWRVQYHAAQEKTFVHTLEQSQAITIRSKLARYQGQFVASVWSIPANYKCGPLAEQLRKLLIDLGWNTTDSIGTTMVTTPPTGVTVYHPSGSLPASAAAVDLARALNEAGLRTEIDKDNELIGGVDILVFVGGDC